jgi:hypothetical protein
MRSRLIAVLSVIALITVGVIAIGSNRTAGQQPVAAAPLSYTSSRYSEAEWLQIGREAVRGMGMVGEPEREQWTLMTRGSYATLQGGGGLPENRDVPLFIYQALGDIPELMMWGGLDSSLKDGGGILLVFDGNTGTLLGWSAYPKDVLAREDVWLDLSFIPADSGPDQSLLSQPIPTPIR